VPGRIKSVVIACFLDRWTIPPSYRMK